MKHYYLTVRANQPKNNAQDILQMFIQQYDNFLIDEVKLEQMISRITIEMGRINQTFTRCKDIIISEIEYPGLLAFSFFTDDHSSDVCSISATIVKRYELSEDIEKSNPL